jgi:putative protease
MDWPVSYGAGSGIPVMNRQAAALLLEEGCEFVTASPELTGKELAVLTAGGVPVTVNVYGRTQLMLLHHCPARTYLGLKRGHRDCRMCDTHSADALENTALEDRLGHSFPLLRLRLPEGCLVRLMNMLPAENTDRREVRFRCAELTDETPEEAGRVIDAFAEYRKTGMKSTSGHWGRPVE